MVKPSVKSSWKFLPGLFVLSTLLAFLAVLEPYLYGRIVDSLVGSVANSYSIKTGFAAIIPFLLLWGGIIVVETTGAAFFSYLAWTFSNKMAANTISEWYARVLKLDVDKFRSVRSGEVMKRFDSLWNGLENISNNFLRAYLESILRFTLALSAGLWIDWRLTLVSLIPIPIAIAIGFLKLHTSSNQQHAVNEHWEHINGHASDSFTNINAVKSHVIESSMVKTFIKSLSLTLQKQKVINRTWGMVEGGYGLVYISGRLLIFTFGAWLVLDGSATLGTLIMFLGFANFLFGSVQQIMSSLPHVSKSFVDIDRGMDFWNEVPVIKEKMDALHLKQVKGSISFDHVSFSYKNDRDVLKDISFSIPAGKMFAIVGESGAGKSTLAQMMMRFHDPIKGSIKLDGHDLRDLTLKSLRKNIGFVMQENLLFHDTVLNNIKLAKPSATQEEIVLAAKRAQAHAFISKFKGGYHAVVGERGVKLSGGEKQRIALTRVFLANPPVLVLDEATSALDSKTEHALQLALKEVMKGRTSLVIAHRLSTVMEADCILVMDKGRLVDEGTHEELIKKEGLYKQYWNLQAGGYL